MAISQFKAGTFRKTDQVVFQNYVAIGQFGPSGAVGDAYGIPLSATYQDASGQCSAFDVFSDDVNAVLGAGEYNGSRSRVILRAAQTADVSLWASKGQLKVKGCTIAGVGNKAGSCGYLECDTAVIGSAGSTWCGVCARVDVPSGSTIAASSVVSAIGVISDLGGTHTGIAAVIDVIDPAGGVWDSLVNVSSTSGCYVASDVGAASNKKLIISVDGSPFAIKLYAVS